MMAGNVLPAGMGEEYKFHHPSSIRARTRNTGPCPARPSAWYMPASAPQLSTTCPLRVIVSHRHDAGIPRDTRAQIEAFSQTVSLLPNFSSRLS